MQSKQYKIYILTSPRGLHYVGMTSDEPKIRWRKGYSKNTKIAKEIEQYGFDNFKKEILEYADTLEEARKLEAHYIEKYDCVNSGLNFLKSAYDNPYNYMKHTQETKDKISRLASARYKGSGNPMYNKHHTEEAKLKMGLHRKNNKPLMCIENGKVYRSIGECARDLGCSKSGIKGVIHDRVKTCKGYTFKLI